MQIKQIKAIDVHAHFGDYLAEDKIYADIMSGDIDTVGKMAKQANTKVTIVSSLKAFFPEPGNPASANIEAVSLIKNKIGFMFWIVVDPMCPETFVQAEVFSNEKFFAGIKIHPLLHKYPIKKYGGRIFEFAAKNQFVVQSHSGQDNCMPEDFVDFADSFPEVKIIISHLGCSDTERLTLQMDAILKSKKNNLFTDTSSFRSIFPGLIEMAVKNIGAYRILYGTDTPLYFSPSQRARIDNADISDAEKLLILRENALNIFGHKLRRVSRKT